MRQSTSVDLRLVPAYTVTEAAHYLRVPEATVRSWLGKGRNRGLIRLDGVATPKVRSALDYVSKHFRFSGLSIRQAFLAGGLDLFVERYGHLINASREGQQAIKEIIGVYLERIERDAKGVPIKLYPFTRDTAAKEGPARTPRLVVMNPAISFGRPVISGTGIPVSSIYERYKAGDSVADLARDFRLETGAIEEAIRCEAA